MALVFTGCANTDKSVPSSNKATEAVSPDTNTDVITDSAITDIPVETIPEITATPVPTATQIPEIHLNNKPGETVTFGSYEFKDHNGEAWCGTKPIEWIVLSNDDEKMLLWCKYIVDYRNDDYSSGDHSFKDYPEDVDVTWEDCALRKWLNDDFYNTAFDNEEKTHIIKTHLDNKDVVIEKLIMSYGPYVMDCGNPTDDNVFVMSYDELLGFGFGRQEEYDINRRCANAYRYYIEHIGDDPEYLKNWRTPEGYRCSVYWLRNHGFYKCYATTVEPTGLLDYMGRDCGQKLGVRPAIYVKVK